MKPDAESGRFSDRVPGPSPLAAALTAALSILACYPRPSDPIGLAAPPAPFERAPYVQNVSDSVAWILWLARTDAPDTAWVRVPAVDSAWIAVEPEDHLGGTRRARLPLVPGAEVQYRVAVGGARFGPHTFNAAPRGPTARPDGRAPAGSGAAASRVLLYGDSGWGGAEQIALARQMRRSSWDLAIHVGDIAYDDGTEEEFTERHFRVYAGTLAETPFFPAVGNHDLRADEGRPYDAAFLWPAPYENVRYYAFRWNRTIFLSVDTSSHTEDVAGLRGGGGRQLEWIERTLREAAADNGVDWIVVFQHNPLYSHAIGISGHDLDRALRANLLPLYERYGVDLVAAGHDHHYERTWPIRGGARVEDGCGPVHVVTGGGGASRYARDLTTTPLLAWGGRVYEYVELQIGTDRIQGRTIDGSGAVLDQFTVLPYSGLEGGLPDRCAR